MKWRELSANPQDPNTGSLYAPPAPDEPLYRPTRRPGQPAPSTRPAKPTTEDLQRFSVQTSLDLGIDPAAELAKIGIESEFNPNAMGPVTKSGERAHGPAQIMPSTARAYAQKYGQDPDKVLSDPFENIKFGAHYFNDQLDQFGDAESAARAYNAGPAAVEKSKHYKETNDYVNRFNTAREHYARDLAPQLATYRATQRPSETGSSVAAAPSLLSAASPAGPSATPVIQQQADQSGLEPPMVDTYARTAKSAVMNQPLEMTSAREPSPDQWTPPIPHALRRPSAVAQPRPVQGAASQDQQTIAREREALSEFTGEDTEPDQQAPDANAQPIVDPRLQALDAGEDLSAARPARPVRRPTRPASRPSQFKFRPELEDAFAQARNVGDKDKMATIGAQMKPLGYEVGVGDGGWTYVKRPEGFVPGIAARHSGGGALEGKFGAIDQERRFQRTGTQFPSVQQYEETVAATPEATRIAQDVARRQDQEARAKAVKPGEIGDADLLLTGSAQIPSAKSPFDPTSQPGGPSVGPRDAGLIGNLIEDLSPPLRKLAPGLASLNTPAGIQTDVAEAALKHAVSGATLGAYKPGSVQANTPERQGLVDAAGTAGEFIAALLPYKGAGVALQLATQTPRIMRAMRVLQKAGALQHTVEAAIHSASIFGGVSTAREAVKGLRGESEGLGAALKHIGTETLLGATVGAVTPPNAGAIRQALGFGIPSTLAAAATGETQPPVSLTGQPLIDSAVFNVLMGYGLAHSGGELKVPVDFRGIAGKPATIRMPRSDITEPGEYVVRILKPNEQPPTVQTLNAQGLARTKVANGIGWIIHPKGLRFSDVRQAVRNNGLVFGTGEAPPVPETPETHDSQLQALRAGRVDAVNVTPDAAMPKSADALEKEGLDVTPSTQGTFVSSPDKVSPEEIRKSVEDGTHGEHLGFVAPRYDGPDAVTLVARDARTGHELKSAVIAPGDVEAQTKAFQEQFPQSRVGEEHPHRVLEERVQPRAIDSAGVVERARQRLQSGQAVDDYVAQFGPGAKNTRGYDLQLSHAREVLAPETRSADGLAEHGEALTNEAQQLVDEAYYRALEDPKTTTVVLALGGSGAGKSVAHEAETSRRGSIVLESHGTDIDTLTAMIDEALSRGKKVTVNGISRDPGDAYDSVIDRYKEGPQRGKVVSLDRASQSHAAAPEAFNELKRRFEGEGGVEFFAIDNTGQVPKVAGTMPEVAPDEARSKMQERLDAAAKDRRLSVDEYQRFSGREGIGQLDGPLAEKTRQAPQEETKGTQEGTERPEAEVEASDYGAANKVVTRDRYEALKARLNEEFASQRGSGGPSVQQLAALAEMGAFHIEAGARKFADWSKAMLRDVDWLKPNDLIRIYDDAHAQVLKTSRAKDEAYEAAKKAATAPVEPEGTRGSTQAGSRGVEPGESGVPREGLLHEPGRSGEVQPGTSAERGVSRDVSAETGGEREAGGAEPDVETPKVEGGGKAPERATQTPEFKKWFGGSKVVDGKGEPLVVYHGTAEDIDYLDPDMRGKNLALPSSQRAFWFVKEPDVANFFAKQAGKLASKRGREEAARTPTGLAAGYKGEAVYPVHLKLENPLILDADKKNWNVSNAVARAMKEGRDGVIIKNVGANGPHGEATYYGVFESDNVRSAVSGQSFAKLTEPKPSAEPQAKPAPSVEKAKEPQREPWQMTQVSLSNKNAEGIFPLESKVEVRNGKPVYTYSTTVSFDGEPRTFAIDAKSPPNATTMVERLHKKVVEQALSDGKSVPPEVLADYPDLQAKTEPAKQPRIAPGDSIRHPMFAAGKPLTVKAVDATHVTVDTPNHKDRKIALDSKIGKEMAVVKAKPATVDAAAHEAATSPKNDLPEPTEAQKEATNYQLGHTRIGGLSVSIEHPAGTRRKPEWPKLKDHYGYIRRTEGADGEHIDAFIKPGTPENYDGPVFVVDQQTKEGRFDEHKVMLGWPDEAAARAGYESNYSKGWKSGPIREFESVGDFREWLKTEDTSKPATEIPLQGARAESGGKPGLAAPASEATAAPAPKPKKFAKEITDDQTYLKTLAELKKRVREINSADLGPANDDVVRPVQRKIEALEGLRKEYIEQRDAGKSKAAEPEKIEPKIAQEAEPGQHHSVYQPHDPKSGEFAGPPEFPALDTRAITDAASLARAFHEAAPNLSEEETSAAAQIADARAETWAKQTGKDKAEWFKSRIAGVEGGDAEVAPTKSKKDGWQKVPENIEDFGEKIGGARKDTATARGSQPKAVKEAEGDEPGWRKRFTLSEITKSTESGEEGKWAIYDTKNKDWRGQPRQVGKILFGSKEAAEKAVELAAVSLKHSVVMVRPETPKAEALVDAQPARDMAAKKADEDMPGRTEYRVVENAKSRLAAGRLTPGELERVIAKYGEAASLYTPLAEAKPDPDYRYEIWRRVTDRKRVKVVTEQFDTREDAMKYMADNAVKIIETKTNFGEEILAKPDKVVRAGAERRTGPATKEMFGKDFGFRSVEFGNWNNQDERQEVMNHAYDGLRDLAEVLDVPPKALSLNGELSLAFGARGQGLSGAKAHYERDYGVINLTKMSGAGSLAHEWFHAFDHYLGRQDTKAGSEKKPNARGDLVYPANTTSGGDMASYGFSAGKKLAKDAEGRLTATDEDRSGVREKLRDAYTDLIKTMFTKGEQYVEDTQKAEKFVGAARDDLAQKLSNIRDGQYSGLSKQIDTTYRSRNTKPASAEHLAEFDRLAESLINGEDLKTQHRYTGTSGDKPVMTRGGGIKRGAMSGRFTNDTLEAIGAIMKAVRGRGGFNAEGRGPLDEVRHAMTRYQQRVDMLRSANEGETKTKQTPTSYAMEAKKLDEGRASDYWRNEHEMAARAFSAYVEDKIQESGHQSDFLSYGSDNKYYRWLGVQPFPEGKERVAIDQAFDKVFETLESKETDKGTALYQEGTKQTDTSEFKKFFRDSKVVDKKGDPLVVYHGTRADFDQFEQRSGTAATVFGPYQTDRSGFFFTADKELAQEFATQGRDIQEGASVLPVFLSLRKPLDLRDGFGDQEIRALEEHGIDSGWMASQRPDEMWEAFDGEDGKNLKAAMLKAGYDGAVIAEPDGAGNLKDSYVAFHPEQIKSATGNRGTFDPNDPNILKQGVPQGVKGATRFLEDNRAVIHAFESADVSTFAHETAHIFRRDLQQSLAEALPEHREQIASDIKAAEEWAGVKDGDWKREHEEKFARGFERFLRDGEAPTDTLKRVFTQFKDWMTNIYQKLKGSEIDVKMSPEIRRVFDNLLGGSEEAAPKTGAKEVAEPTRLTTTEYDQTVEKYKALKESGTTVEEYQRQQGLFGAELNPAQQELLKALDSGKRKGKAGEGQAPLLEITPTAESRAEAKAARKGTVGGPLFPEVLYQIGPDGKKLTSAARDHLDSLDAKELRKAASAKHMGEEYRDYAAERLKTVGMEDEPTKPKATKNQSVVDAIVAAGGINVSKGRGELSELEIKRPGFYNNDSRMRLGDMAHELNARGFRMPDGRELDDENDVIELLHNEQHGESAMNTAADYDAKIDKDWEDWAKQGMSEDEQQDYDLTRHLQETEPEWVELARKIGAQNAEPTEDDIAAFRELSAGHGISDAGIDALIESGREYREWAARPVDQESDDAQAELDAFFDEKGKEARGESATESQQSPTGDVGTAAGERTPAVERPPVEPLFAESLKPKLKTGATKVNENDHWNFARSEFSSPESEDAFRNVIKNAAVESGGAHKVRVSREDTLKAAADILDLHPDLIAEVAKYRPAKGDVVPNVDALVAAARFAESLTNQATELRRQIFDGQNAEGLPLTPDEAQAMDIQAARYEHDAGEIMVGGIGARSEKGRQLALMATVKGDDLHEYAVSKLSSEWRKAGRDTDTKEYAETQADVTRLASQVKVLERKAADQKRYIDELQGGRPPKPARAKKESWEDRFQTRISDMEKDARDRLTKLGIIKEAPKEEPPRVLYQAPDISSDLAVIMAAKLARSKAGEGSLEDIRKSMRDEFGEHYDPERVDALANRVLTNERRSARLEATKEPASASSARAELSKELKDAEKARRDSLVNLEKIKRQSDKAWAIEEARGNREREKLAGKSAPEAGISEEEKQRQIDAAFEAREAGTEHEQDIAATKELDAFLKETATALDAERYDTWSKDAKTEAHNRKLLEQENRRREAEDARERVKQARLDAAEGQRNQARAVAEEKRLAEKTARDATKWQTNVRLNGEAAEIRLMDPDRLNSKDGIGDLAQIGAAKLLKDGMTPQRWLGEMRGYGKAYADNESAIRDRAGEIKREAQEAGKQADLARHATTPKGQYEVVQNGKRVWTGQALNMADALKQSKATNGARARRISESQAAAMTPEQLEQAIADHGATIKAKQDAQRQLVRMLDVRSPSDKVLRFVAQARRAVVLSGMTVLGKLSMAASGRIGFTAAEEGIGTALAQIPGIKQIAAKAPREGPGSLKAERSALSHTFSKETGREMLRVLKTGTSNLDVQYGSKGKYDEFGLTPTPELIEIFGRIHGTLKTPASTNEFYRSLEKRSAFERKEKIASGMSETDADRYMSNPATIARIGAEAWKDGQRAKLMNDNYFVTLYQGMLSALDRAGEQGSFARAAGKGARLALKLELPVVKIPVNFMAEGTSYTTGSLKALGQLVAAKGIKNMTPDQADYVMRNLKKQSVGVAMALAFAAIPGIEAGGYYQEGDNKDKDKPKAGTLRVFGFDVPRWMTHIPALEPLQVAATVRNVYKRVAKQGGSKSEAILGGATAAGVGMLKEVPFIDQPLRLMESVKNWQGTKRMLGTQVRSMVVPPDVQKVAAAMDQPSGNIIQRLRGEATARKPEGFIDEIKMGVPGWRKSVPVDEERPRLDAIKRIEHEIDSGASGDEVDRLIHEAVKSKMIRPLDGTRLSRTKGMTQDQREFARLPLKAAARRWGAMTKEQRESVKELLDRKINNAEKAESVPASLRGWVDWIKEGYAGSPP